MKRFLRWWILVPLVLVLDVVTLAVDAFAPAVRWITFCVLTGLLLLFAFLRLLEHRYMRQQEAAAFEHLERVRKEPGYGQTA